jgi:serine/threonine-protein kinase
MHAVLTRAIASPSSVEPSVPLSLDAVVLRALEREPARRYATAGDFLAALERLPLSVATARRASQYVRREGGASLTPGNFPSGSYPRAVNPAAQDVHEPFREAVDEDSQVEMPTRLFEPPPELVAASAREREPSMPDAYRSRRMIVAIILVLVGCAVGLLFARQPATPNAPPTAPAPAAPANP